MTDNGWEPLGFAGRLDDRHRGCAHPIWLYERRTYEVRNYYDFANDPEALAAIRALLEAYRHPKAESYIPEKAALFIQAVASTAAVGPADDLPVQDWPLNPAWLAAGASTAQCQTVLSGSDLEALLSVTGRNIGDFYFRAGDQVYVVYLVPWLPGVDYTDLHEAVDLPEDVQGQIDQVVSSFELNQD